MRLVQLGEETASALPYIQGAQHEDAATLFTTGMH